MSGFLLTTHMCSSHDLTRSSSRALKPDAVHVGVENYCLKAKAIIVSQPPPCFRLYVNPSAEFPPLFRRCHAIKYQSMNFSTFSGRVRAGSMGAHHYCSVINRGYNAHVIVRSSSTARHEGKYKQFAYRRARNLFHALLDISETLFVLVATSISMSHLVEFQVNDIVPQIEQWWNSCPPSEGLQLQARHVMDWVHDQWRKGALGRPPNATLLRQITLLIFWGCS